MPWLADFIETVMTNRAILASARRDRTLFCRFVIKKYPLRMTKLDSFNLKSTKKQSLSVPWSNVQHALV